MFERLILSVAESRPKQVGGAVVSVGGATVANISKFPLDMQQLAALVAICVGVLTCVSVVLGMYLSWKRDKREERSSRPPRNGSEGH